MEKKKYEVNYEQTRMLWIGLTSFLVIFILALFIFGGFNFGTIIISAIPVILLIASFVEFKPKKAQYLPILEIGTKVFHNPIYHQDNSRLYENEEGFDYRKVLPIWEVVYHGDAEYTIECNGQKRKVSYQRQNNLIKVESVEPKKSAKK